MANPSDLTRAHVFIGGRVQAVSFRYYTARQADMLGIKGWVRNLPNGRVEAVFEGSDRDVQQMVDWCRRGSPSAVVDDVEVVWGQPEGSFRSFQIKF